MKLGRLSALVGAVLLLAAVAAPAATAATYPASDNTVSIEGGSTDIKAGDEVSISAKTFQGESDVTFTVSSPIASLGSGRGGAALAGAAASGSCETGSSCVVVADADGVATALVSFTQPGKHTVTAEGTDPNGEPLTVTSTVTVADAAADDTDGTDDSGDESPDSGGLANTGADLIQYAVIGLGLVAVGAVIMIALRRRSTGSAV